MIPLCVWRYISGIEKVWYWFFYYPRQPFGLFVHTKKSKALKLKIFTGNAFVISPILTSKHRTLKVVCYKFVIINRKITYMS